MIENNQYKKTNKQKRKYHLSFYCLNNLKIKYNSILQIKNYEFYQITIKYYYKNFYYYYI